MDHCSISADTCTSDRVATFGQNCSTDLQKNLLYMWGAPGLSSNDNLFCFVMQHSMIFFFHHYELPALLEQIRQQQQQQPGPPHHNEQAADGHTGPDSDTPPADDSDQSGGSGQPLDSEAEQQELGVRGAIGTDSASADADDASPQLSSVDHTVQGHYVGPVECNVQQLYVSHSVDAVDEATRLSAAETRSTSTTSSFRLPAVTSLEDSQGCCAVDTVDARVRCDLPLSLSCDATNAVPVDAADDRGLELSSDIDPSMVLRRRHQASNSASLSSSQRAFTNGQELCANQPRGDETTNSAETLTDNSRGEMQ